MTQYSIDTRGGLPTEMQALLREYPRDAWPDHPNFAASIQNWMGAHQMFRKLAGIVRGDTEPYLDNDLDLPEFSCRQGLFVNLLIRNLHGHHGWEDREYFPELSRADPRFDRGLEMLEGDHQELDQLLDRITGTANRTIKLAQLEPRQVPGEAGQLLETTGKLQGFLERHLEDEEDLIVPILLHHKLRG